MAEIGDRDGAHSKTESLRARPGEARRSSAGQNVSKVTSSNKAADPRPPELAPRYSPSVESAIRRFAPTANIGAWVIVKALLRRHPEYGQGRGAGVASAREPASSHSRTIGEWMTAVDEVVKSRTIHGRLLILALCRLDQQLSEYLDSLGLRLEIERELDVPVSEVLRPIARLHDRTPVQLDSPAERDALGRRGFARALALRIDRIWNEYNRSTSKGSFMVHVHGRWGSGKSSILRLVREELQERREVASRWIVVEFNAWQHQRIDPPWWPLLTSIHQQTCNQLSHRFGYHTKSMWLRARELAWRTFTLRRDAVMFAGVLAMALGLLYLVVRIGNTTTTPAGNTEAGNLKDLVALVSAVIGLLTVAVRSITVQQTSIEGSSDPMDRVASHFRRFVELVNQPIVVLIDDLDRCYAPFTVRLLEGVQTLFPDPRVAYVVAADREWLHTAFEQTYSDFREAVGEPGRPLGSLFLDKAFELSASVPRMSDGLRSRYWHLLLEGRASEQHVLPSDEVRALFAAATSEKAIAALLNKPSGASAATLRTLAVERLAEAPFDESNEYFLEPFAKLVDPNPRAMKRIVNAYSMHRDLAILGGLDVLGDASLRGQLALWTIVSMRWPLLADHLVREATGQTASPPSAAIVALLQDKVVQQVIDGGGLSVPLTLDAISRFVEAEAATPVS